MLERLTLLINHYNLTASSFADKIGVPRSSISHLLSGRNKPSLDFVMKIVETFEDVNLNWIVYGKGNFPSNNEAVSNSIQKITEEINVKENTATISNLFSDDELLVSSEVDKQKVKKEISNEPLGHKEPEIITSVDNHRKKSKSIKKIVLLFNDGSFEEYNP